MPKVIQMPSLEELPPGAQRQFMEALYRLWVEAGQPATAKVSARIEAASVGVV
ncbi:hypothetical protein O4J56_04510 [Nocardiopsis sp. RSe5-2]|uniref:Uncharacterized protein n=1 Tax=Nocardiopsis endophytica TaxID=3018445 RepID=A0ABT4TYV6_9ACTN|nr:hypothetical protein [Nocardiopsis endophytica]MDA2809891.1 hypothetical protein [Nocardiopsis endophytica]